MIHPPKRTKRAQATRSNGGKANGQARGESGAKGHFRSRKGHTGKGFEMQKPQGKATIGGVMNNLEYQPNIRTSEEALNQIEYNVLLIARRYLNNPRPSQQGLIATLGDIAVALEEYRNCRPYEQ